MVAGAIAAMVSTFAIGDRAVRDQAVTLALGLPTALASISLGALLNPHIVAGDIFFILLIFGAAYARRFGMRGAACGQCGDRSVPQPGVHHQPVQQHKRGAVAAGVLVFDRPGGQLDLPHADRSGGV
jgi:hypothetical protein